MKLNKPKFWEKKNIISILLLPLSIAYLLIFSLVKKITKPKEFNIPVLCVGNIYLGGTGKTPLTRKIFNIIKSLNKNPYISKSYLELLESINLNDKFSFSISNKLFKKMYELAEIIEEGKSYLAKKNLEQIEQNLFDSIKQKNTDKIRLKENPIQVCF